ncbi:hypothetical protein ASF10_22140 [Flavobacterium sp. Leaf82]|uniref:non-ribosomal peptide synthetase n=1 Tax=unclassified Flavobacterium TaxID=196869 RepID=UPI0006F744E7|nr:non-ribosomal peptide synthetase [Flavobacterium sp. Leaf82]KQO31340.1 hypothetical protein ASF10_22140 [Flavobacterium sp. Leaf82]
MSKVRELLVQLKNNDIDIQLENDQLEVFYDGEELDEVSYNLIKDNKQDIIQFFKNHKIDSDISFSIPLADHQKSYPLSAAQNQLWILSQFDGGNSAYNLSGVHEFEGDLDIKLVEASFRFLIKRHESLRTIFNLDNEGDAKQYILEFEDIDFVLPFEDFRATDHPDTLNKSIEKEQVKPFNLSKDLPFRVKIFQTGESKFLLSLVMHHIISDGWSMEVMVKDFFGFYSGVKKEEQEVVLPELNIQYKDYAVWQHDMLKNKKLDQNKEYWIDKFSGDLPTLVLPSQKPRPPIKTYNGKTLNFVLNPDLLHSLKELNREHGVTLFMSLLGLVKLLLSKYSHQQDIIIGSASSGRENADLKNLIGFFVNALPLRTIIKNEESFIDLLNNVKSVTIGASENQIYPLDELIKNLTLYRDMSRSGLFDVMLDLRQSFAILDEEADIQLEALTIKPYIQVENLNSRFDLYFNFIEKEEGLGLSLTYNTDIYSQAFVEQLAKHLEQLLANALRNPSLPVSKIEYLNENEKIQLLEEFNQTKEDFPKDKTVINLFEEQVERTPDKEALFFDNKRFTYRELNEKANQLAAYLQENYDIQENDIVGIKLDKSETFIVAILGILKSGAAYLPIDINYPQDRIDFIESDSKCKVVLDQEELMLYNFERFRYGNENPVSRNKASDLAYVIYTSGTTGNPKGVMVEHWNLVNSTLSRLNYYQVDRILLISSFAFDSSIAVIWSGLLGGTLVVEKDEVIKDIETITKRIIDNKITDMLCVPSYYSVLFEAFKKEKANLNLRNVILAGEAIKLDIIATHNTNFDEIGLYNEYGPTECTVWATVAKINDCKNVIPIGKPISNTQIYILDKELQIVSKEITGRIYISGDSVARGYLNHPDLTAKKFIEDPFILGQRMYDTGDIGRWLPDGSIEFLGREDHQVKIRGFRIELGEIEIAISEYSKDITHVVAEAKEVNDEKVLVAYFVCNTEVDKTELKDFLHEKLPEYMVPTFFVELDTLPLTPNGKTDRKALPNIGDDDVIKGEYIGARSKEEKVLVDVWEEVLKRESISVKDNFYNLGGDSIKSIQIISKLKQRGYTLTLLQLFNNPVLEELAQYIEVNNKVADQSEVVGEVELTPIQNYFFKSPIFKYHNHYNQSVVLKSKELLDPEILERCFTHLINHHDALRMTFLDTDGLWKQRNERNYKENIPLNFYDLTDDNNEKGTIAKLGEELQAGFKLDQGGLLKIALFRLKDGDRLAIIVHHLVVDGVSWRILLEDLTLLYIEYKKGNDVKLPLKSDSFQKWSLMQKEYANGDKIASEKPYWEALANEVIPNLPSDNEIVSREFEVKDMVSFTLPHDITNLLQTKVNSTYKTEVNDVLLAALAIALKESVGITKSILQIEGHGREEIIPNIDISRTIGWFTTVYPFVLKTSGTNALKDTLIETKESLRKIPNKGIGYGILKYLSSQSIPDIHPSIAFNYLGDFGDNADNKEKSILGYASESIGLNIDPRNKRDVALEITGIMVEGKLSMNLRYAKEIYHTETVKKIMDSYEAVLTNLIEDLAKADQSYLTPSDLSFKEISIEDLSQINTDGNIENIYKLSPLQQGLYFHWSAEPSSSMYFEQISYRINVTDLNVENIKTAYNKLIQRHGVLRTSFTENLVDEPLQIVRKKVEGDFIFLKIANQSVDSFINETKQNDKEKGFNLENPTQMRLLVLDLGNNEFEFIWSHHHILIDGWCMSILINDFYQILNSVNKNISIELPAAKPYSNYIEWLEKIDKEKSLSFWNDYLKDYSNVAQIPFKIDNTQHSAYKESVETLKLEEDLFEKMNNLCQEIGITQNTFIQGIWGLLLSKYNNTQDVVFGSVVSGRPGDLLGIETMIGLFINTIPVRIKYEAEDTAALFLKEIQNAAALAHDHHYLNLSEVQSQSELGMNLINHILVFENYLVQENIQNDLSNNGEELTIKSVEIFEQTNYDFNLIIVPGKLSLKIDFKYNENRFDMQLIKNVVHHFKNFVEQICLDVNQPINSLVYLTAFEKEKLTVDFNDTEVSYPKEQTIVDLFESQASKFPARIAILSNAKNITYKELNTLSNQLSNYLIANYNIKDKDVIGVKLERNEYLIIAILGILKSEGIYLPIDINLPEKRIEYIKNDSQYKVVIDALFIKEFLKHKDDYSDLNIKRANKSNDVAYIIYTSGTTGQPKGTSIEHHSLVNRLVWMQKLYNLSDTDVIMQKTPNSFDVSVWELLWWAAEGSKVTFLKDGLEKDPSEIIRHIAEFDVTVMHFVPSMLTQFLEYVESEPESISQLKSLKRIYASGEALSVTTNNKFHELFDDTKLINLYGPTEATIDVTYFECSKNLNTIPIGKPIDNTMIYILDQQHNIVPIGIEGTIFIAGAGLARGYLNKPELTSQKFIPNPFITGDSIYNTGDLGKWRLDGNIEYLGRNDDQVKIRGNRIELSEISNTLETYEQIKTAHALKIKDKLVAFIQFADEVELNSELESHLRNELLKSLPAYMIPHHFYQIKEIPLSSNGKLDRKKLIAIYEASIDGKSMEESIKSLSPKSLEMAGIWAEVLDISINSINSELSFIEQGGDSLTMLKVVAICKKRGYSVTIKDFMMSPYLHFLESVNTKKQQVVTNENKETSKNENTPFLLSPIQQYFFDVNKHKLNFVMHASYFIDSAYNLKGIEKSFDDVTRDHDSFSLRFKKEKGVWQQYYDYNSLKYVLEESKDENMNVKKAIEKAIIAIDIEKGPLLYINVFYEEEKPVMFIACHHLIMDAVSWQILLSDIQLNYIK